MLGNQTWWVYAALCRNGAIYVGSAKDVDLRIEQHNAGRGGPYTRNSIPLKFLWKEPHRCLESALRRESQIKRWTRRKKTGPH